MSCAILIACTLAFVGPSRAPARARAAPRGVVHASTPTAFADAQWDLLLAHQEGFWKGVWSSCDADGAPIDELEADSAWVRTKTGKELIQVNTYFVGSVRANCEVCQDSVEGRQLQVGSYAPGAMAGVRLAGRGVAFGPRVTKRGALTAEVGLRDGVSRLRVLFTYDPRYAPTGGPPTALELGRLTVIRECLDRPPLVDEPRGQSAARPSGEAADFWWADDGAPLLGLWKGERARYTVDALSAEPLAPTHLRACRCANPAAAADAADERADAGSVALVLPGGIRIDCPRQIAPATPVELAVAWRPAAGGPTLHRASLALTALGRVVTENADEVVMTPPTCDGFVVEALEQLPPI